MSESQPRKVYTTDLTGEQWAIVELIVSKDRLRSPRGRRREVCLREVINSIQYLNRTGCQWELLPHDLLPG